MITQTKNTMKNMSPAKALLYLKSGNQRFLHKEQRVRDLLYQTILTSSGQYPFAVILGCVDSRVPPELVFDLGIGDVFSIRIAGNCINEDILGSMEFATTILGSKQILVLGHTGCGAIQAAIDQVKLGNLTGLVNKLQPAVEAVKNKIGPGIAHDIDQIATMNVSLTIEDIKQKSPILRDMFEKKEIGISGAMYDVYTGKVDFL